MKPLWSVLLAGSLALGSGCSTLRHGTTFRPASDRAAAAAAPVAQPTPAVADYSDIGIDPFHPKSAPSPHRLSRFFPGLARAEGAAAPKAETLRRPGPRSWAKDQKLQAIPRPEANRDDEAETAAMKGEPDRAPLQAEPVARSDSEDDRRDLPLLAAAVVAEADPDEDSTQAPHRTPAERTRRARQADRRLPRRS